MESIPDHVSLAIQISLILAVQWHEINSYLPDQQECRRLLTFFIAAHDEHLHL